MVTNVQTSSHQWTLVCVCVFRLAGKCACANHGKRGCLIARLQDVVLTIATRGVVNLHNTSPLMRGWDKI